MTTLTSNTFIRELELIGDIGISIHQLEIGDVGCVVWDAAIVLAKYLDTADFNFGKGLRGKRVLELGSGTGVVGLVAAVRGADVLITDLPEFLPLMNKNIKENRDHITGSIAAQSLVWGEDIVHNDFDIVLLADCIYYEKSLNPLVECIVQHCNEDTTVLCCYEQRTTGNKPELERKFNELMNEKFLEEVIPIERQDELFNSEDILIKTFKKKPD